VGTAGSSDDEVSMGAVDISLAVVALASGLATMIFFVVVLVEMFKRQQTGIAITCIVLFLTTLMGPLVAFVYGWLKAKEWNLRRNMLAWTGCLVVCLISAVICGALAVARAQARQQRLNQELQQQVEVEELKVETP
jgi:hypothetical protein